jgi:uncharacterized membrane protein YedE/YeeE
VSPDFTPFPALAGGILLGIASTWLLVANGRIAGISGIFSGMFLQPVGERLWRAWFVGGLIAAGLLWQALAVPAAGGTALPLGWTALAGALVGFGARLGNGCTSGHAICGMARLSPRSAVAVAGFVAAGMASAYVVRHVLGIGV